MVHSGKPIMPNASAVLVEDYLTRHHLSKIGISINENIDVFEAEYLTYIGSCLAELENEEIKRASRKK
jgi:hypothetical protein